MTFGTLIAKTWCIIDVIFVRISCCLLELGTLTEE